MMKPPSRLPLFVLHGVALPPRCQMPFFIFEPRYRAMIDDVLAGHGMIGIIQQALDCDEDVEDPPPARCGSAGIVTACEEATTPGCRNIMVTGLCRFRVTANLEIPTLYRQADVDYAPFADDLEPAPDHDGDDPQGDEPERAELLAAIEIMLNVDLAGADRKRIQTLRTADLINLAMIASSLPPREKQAMLETPKRADQAKLLIAFSRMRQASRLSGGDSLQ